MNSSMLCQNNLKVRLETIKNNIRSARISNTRTPSLIQFLGRNELSHCRKNNQSYININLNDDKSTSHKSYKRENKDTIDSMFKNARRFDHTKLKQDCKKRKKHILSGFTRGQHKLLYEAPSTCCQKIREEYEERLHHLQQRFEEFKEEREYLIDQIHYKDQEIKLLRSQLSKFNVE